MEYKIFLNESHQQHSPENMLNYLSQRLNPITSSTTRRLNPTTSSTTNLLNQKNYVNFNDILTGNENNKNTTPVISTIPNMNQQKQTIPNMNQQKQKQKQKQKQTIPNMNQQKQKQRTNQSNIIGSRRSVRLESMNSRITWPRNDLKFELYAFNFKEINDKNDKSYPNTSEREGITEDIINKQFGLRTVNNENNIIFKKDDEVVGFYETCVLSENNSKKVLNFFDGKNKEKPTNIQIMIVFLIKIIKY
jgi:hypothetical protein